MARKRKTPSIRTNEMAEEDVTEKPTTQNEKLSAYLRPMQPYVSKRKKIGNPALLRAYKKSTDHRERAEAKNILVYGNMPLVVKIARAYTDRGVPFFDLIQEGVLGLMKSIDKFKMDKGCQLSTYATHWIRQMITRAIDEAGDLHPYRIPIHVQDEMRLVRRAMHLFKQEIGRWPNDSEIIEQVRILQRMKKQQISPKHAILCRELILTRLTSFDEDYRTNDQGELKNIAETIGDRHAYGNVEILLQAKQHRDGLILELDNIISAINRLPERQALIILMRLGVAGHQPEKLEEIGKKICLCRERVRQIEFAGHAIIEKRTGFSKKKILDLLQAIERLDHLVQSLN